MTRDTAERAKELSPEQRKYAHELAEAVALKWLSRPLDEQDIHAGLMWVLAAIEKFGMRVQAEARLEEAKWWHEQLASHEPGGVPGLCRHCQRVAALAQALQPAKVGPTDEELEARCDG